ncbi:MAG: hypothetical protein ACKV2T_31885 [Kofleriaceae bacterium]
MSYLVVAPPWETERPEISLTTVTEEVLRRWPDADISMDASGPFTTRWWAMNKRFEGKLYRHGRGVVVDGPFEIVLDFAIWVRRAIGRDVVFTDLGNDGAVEVRASMSAAELAAAYDAGVGRNR